MDLHLFKIMTSIIAFITAISTIGIVNGFPKTNCNISEESSILLNAYGGIGIIETILMLIIEIQYYDSHNYEDKENKKYLTGMVTLIWYTLVGWLVIHGFVLISKGLLQCDIARAIMILIDIFLSLVPILALLFSVFIQYLTIPCRPKNICCLCCYISMEYD